MRGLEVRYAEVQAVVSRFAREQKIQVVLVKTDKELKAADFNDWGSEGPAPSVIFADPSLDITDQVLRLLSPGSAPPAGSPPPARLRRALGRPASGRARCRRRSPRPDACAAAAPRAA